MLKNVFLCRNFGKVIKELLNNKATGSVRFPGEIYQISEEQIIEMVHIKY